MKIWFWSIRMVTIFSKVEVSTRPSSSILINKFILNNGPMIWKKIIDQPLLLIALIQEINVRSFFDTDFCFSWVSPRRADMDYEFLVRTADNVEIILDVSIFWQITDLYKLVLVTQDPPEDICKRKELNWISHCLWYFRQSYAFGNS